MNVERWSGLDLGINETPALSGEVLEIIGAVSPAIQRAWEISQPEPESEPEEVKPEEEEGVLSIPSGWETCRIEIEDIEPFQLRNLSLGIRIEMKMGHSIVDGGIEVSSLPNGSREEKLKVLAAAFQELGIATRFVFS